MDSHESGLFHHFIHRVFGECLKELQIAGAGRKLSPEFIHQFGETGGGWFGGRIFLSTSAGDELNNRLKIKEKQFTTALVGELEDNRETVDAWARAWIAQDGLLGGAD
ncbi:MAG: hypothetical protein EBX52_01795 [Proteobacteria bacterium]|nr:hypothetical protein [Pseudomonadota bacterium]